jgi:hypothetical protein
MVCTGNEGEAALVCHHVSRLVAAGVKPADIAVITPYNLQVCASDRDPNLQGCGSGSQLDPDSIGSVEIYVLKCLMFSFES